MPRIVFEAKTEVEIDIKVLAKCFAHMNDEDQAQFFIEVAEISETWGFGGDTQWWYVGSHLRNCECSSDAARDMIRTLAEGVEKGTHGDKL
jgi:hypothetical protein